MAELAPLAVDAGVVALPVHREPAAELGKGGAVLRRADGLALVGNPAHELLGARPPKASTPNAKNSQPCVFFSLQHFFFPPLVGKKKEREG